MCVCVCVKEGVDMCENGEERERETTQEREGERTKRHLDKHVVLTVDLSFCQFVCLSGCSCQGVS